MQKVVALIIIGLIVGLGISYIFLKKNVSYPTNAIQQLTQKDEKKMESEASKIEVVASGIKRPHGIGFNNGIVYVSSETDKILYKIMDGKPQKFVELDFTHDMIFDRDGSIITPVFNENRVVKIFPDGKIENLFSNLSGPNGIVKDKNGDFYVSNYFSGKVLALKNDGRRYDISIGDHKGPAGLAYSEDKLFMDDLWVASYIDGTFSQYNLQEKLGSQLRAFHFKFDDITHPESLYLTKDNKLLATAVKNGKGVVIKIGNIHTQYETLLETDLPDPLVGYFTDEGVVYLVSPNDPAGRVLKVKIF